MTQKVKDALDALTKWRQLPDTNVRDTYHSFGSAMMPFQFVIEAALTAQLTAPTDAEIEIAASICRNYIDPDKVPDVAKALSKIISKASAKKCEAVGQEYCFVHDRLGEECAKQASAEDDRT